MKCDDCDFQMLPTDAVCEGCGAEYEVAGADPEPTPTPAPKQAAKPAAARPQAAATRGATRPQTSAKRASTPAPADDAEDEGGGTSNGDPDHQRCFSCAGPIGEENKCLDCGIVGDDLPF